MSSSPEARTPAEQLNADRREFLALSEVLQNTFDKQELQITIYKDPMLPHFSSRPVEDRARVLWQLDLMNTLSSDLEREGKKLVNTSALVWAFLKNMRWTAPDGLFDRIEAEDLVDIYNTSHQLIFANLYFFKLTSYTLEQLYSLPWTVLFGRDNQEVYGMLRDASVAALEVASPVFVDTDHIPEHDVIESMAELDRRANITPQFCAPLFQNGRPVGYTWVNKVLGVSEKPRT